MANGDPQDETRVREGQFLAGKYRVEKVLGTGGMGVVVAAHHVQLDERVAIKFLLPAMLSNKDVVGRFAREARAAVRIKSEHVVRVFDVGTLESGAPYMVMEYLEGRDLAAWLQRHGPLPIEQAVDFILQACVAVADAHGLGIVHRDLKPANLFCVRRSDGQIIIKVLDFGISKNTGSPTSEADGSMTNTSAVMGSPLYMSPEQMQSAKDVDAKTDIWSLGIILYELLTGSRPFVGQSFAEIAIRVATASFPPVRSLRHEAPAGLEAVILKCLEKDKAQRYRNVAELALALEDFGSIRARASIERIVAIIEGSGLASTSPALSRAAGGRPTATPATEVAKIDETAVQPDPSVVGSLSTMAASTHTSPGVRGRPTRAVVLSIAVAVSIAAGVGWLVLAKPRPTVAANLPSASTPNVTVTSPPTVVEPPRPVELPAMAPAPPIGTASSPTAASGAPSEKAEPDVVLGKGAPNGGLHSHPTQAPAPFTKPAAAAGSASRPNCNPNFTWGPVGNKVFKPECF